MVGNVLIGVVIALIAAFLGGLIGIGTKKEIKQSKGILNSVKEVLIFFISLILLIVSTEDLVRTLVIFALGALTTTILNKFWLGKANRYFEISLLGLAIGAAFSFGTLFGFILTAVVVLYNLIAESVTIVTVQKKRLSDSFKAIAITQTFFVFGVILSTMLFAITKVLPVAFMVYLSGAMFFLVFEPGRRGKTGNY